MMGKGKWATSATSANWGVPGLGPALMEALAPIAPEEPELPDIVKKMEAKIKKVSERFKEDERAKNRCSATAAKAFIEEFVEHTMTAIAGLFWDRPWSGKVSFVQPMLLTVLHTFPYPKCFTRVLKPQVIKYIEDGLFKWSEEERIQKAMNDAVDTVGIQEAYKRKAIKALQTAYDDAHFRSPYGTTQNDSAELALLQDFVKGWMTEFSHKSWDIMEMGLTGPTQGKEAQVATLATLFQNLMDPNIACMPADIATEVTNSLGGLPATPWPFIDETAAVVVEINEEAHMTRAQKRFKKFGPPYTAPPEEGRPGGANPDKTRGTVMEH